MSTERPIPYTHFMALDLRCFFLGIVISLLVPTIVGKGSLTVAKARTLGSLKPIALRLVHKVVLDGILATLAPAHLSSAGRWSCPRVLGSMI